MDRRHTLEFIGQDFGITRERVRQIEKAALAKIKKEATEDIKQISDWLKNYLKSEGYLSLTADIAGKVGAGEPKHHSYVNFLATVAPDIEVIEDDDLHPTIVANPFHDPTSVKNLVGEIIKAINKVGHPVSLAELGKIMPIKVETAQLKNAASASKQLTSYNGKWGLTKWPEVNPRSIRDKTYLILKNSGKPMHFSIIANEIKSFSKNPRNVTVQAVHNELIKDKRFVLIGRGIYALAEWGYQPGTVSDIISEILKEESPLHKDEIISRVLKRRQVKPTTVILNLQEKEQFQRVAKATYRLRT